MRNIHRLWVVLGVLSMLGIGGGCATQKELWNTEITPVTNPIGGPAVRIVKVTDSRKFEAKPEDIHTPSLANSDGIKNSAVTLRSIGMGAPGLYPRYYHYPQARTVETVTRAVMENALRTKGYSVLSENSPSAAGAIPVEVEIRKFWISWDWGFWTAQINFDVELEVKSPILLNSGVESAVGHYDMQAMEVWDTMCEKCLGDGLDDLQANVQTKLKTP